MSERPPLRTARLFLAPYRRGDAAALHRLWGLPEVRRYLLDDEVVSLRWVRDEIGSSIESFRDHGYGQYTMRLEEEGHLVGFCGLRRFRGAETPQLLYGLDPEFWGRGYATEASAAVLDEAFDRLGFESVLASTDEPNAASIEVMRRLGMRLLESRPVAGRATLFYQIGRREWARRNACGETSGAP